MEEAPRAEPLNDAKVLATGGNIGNVDRKTVVGRGQVSECRDGDVLHRQVVLETQVSDATGGLTLQVQLSQLEEVKSRLLSFGVRAEVEEPAQLREMLAHDLTTLAARYGSNRRAKR